MPGVLVPGVMAPVEELIVNPADDVKVPPCDPVSCAFTTGVEVQTADGYVSVAEGDPVIVTVVVVVKSGHPFPDKVYLIV